MSRHVVVGAGPVGSAVARLLLAQGEQVSIVTRSGSGPEGTERIAADAGDATRLSAVCAGAVAIYNCVNPPYDRWAQAWPPVSRALLAAAESSGAVLAVTGNLYPYGPVTSPMTEGMPDAGTGTKARVRAAMTQESLARHRAGRIRVVEVRGSDYLGGNSLLSTLIAPALRKGRRAFVPADLDAPHTFTNVVDVARLLVTAAADQRAWGSVWHVPSAPPVSVRELTQVAAGQLGVRARVTALPYAALWLAGATNPFVRELRETQYQWRAPYVLDSSRAQQTFGLTPASIEDSVRLDLATATSATAASDAARR